MAMAMRDRAKFRRMAFDLEVEDDWPPVSVETVWVKVAEGGKFRIDSIPFFVTGIAVGDLVEGDTDQENVLRFARKIEGSGHSTIQVIVIADDAASAVKEEIKRAGCPIEGSPWPSLFSIDVPDGEVLAEVHRLLDMHAAAGEIEYQDANLAG
jgi:Domain of unknown function (DUF4265)